MVESGPEGKPKKIVYLWGAGATQAEISHIGSPQVNLTMSDNALLGGAGIASRILGKLDPVEHGDFNADGGMDIEKLISLLAASNVTRHTATAETLRQAYFADICSNLGTTKVLEHPELAVGLLRMHNNAYFRGNIEQLSGIITTNHDGLLQRAAQEVLDGVNIGVPFVADDLRLRADQAPIVQLHGSFTWRFGLPIKITPLEADSTYLPDAVWIPPTILKESKNYPFNKLAGIAYELLSRDCDVLRIVGSSLTQNDWNVQSMIFNAQRHREIMRGSPFVIELVVPPDVCQRLSDDCSYLGDAITIEHLSDGDFSVYDERPLPGDAANILAFWLRQKIQFHRQRGHFGAGELDPVLARIAGDPS